MSIQQVRNLIKQSPVAFDDYQAAWKKHYVAAEKVLALHIESRQYGLTKHQRGALRTRLMHAAKVVEHLATTAADDGRTNQYDQDMQLFNKIAEELGLTPDELTQRLFGVTVV